jgi:hypothetical protein
LDVQRLNASAGGDPTRDIGDHAILILLATNGCAPAAHGARYS